MEARVLVAGCGTVTSKCVCSDSSSLASKQPRSFKTACLLKIGPPCQKTPKGQSFQQALGQRVSTPASAPILQGTWRTYTEDRISANMMLPCVVFCIPARTVRTTEATASIVGIWCQSRFLLGESDSTGNCDLHDDP